MTEPKVLIVIPTLNEIAHIEGVVERMLGEANQQTTVVIVDGGSHDGTLERVRQLSAMHSKLHLLQNSRRIQSAAVNLAVSHFGSDAEVLVRCDAHALYPNGFLGRLLESLDTTGADAVVVPLDSVGTTPLQRAIAWVSNSVLGTGGAAHRAGRMSGFVDHGHHAAFRMTTFQRAGGYDETFTHNEDAEFDCRQRALGAKVYLNAGVRVTYYPRATFGALFRQYFAYGVGRSRTVRRHPRSLRLRQLLVPVNFVACTIALGLSPWLPAGLLWPACYLAILALSSLQFVARYRTLSGALVGVAAAVMHFAWALGFIAGLLFHRESVWHPQSNVPPPLRAASRGRFERPLSW